MRDVIWGIQAAENLIKHIRHNLEQDETIGLTTELVETLKLLDQDYKVLCDDFDAAGGQPEGTTYNSETGPNVEFYIESDDWHKISQALRKLK